MADVVVKCAQGYTGPMTFPSNAKAQAWIDRMAERHEKDSRFCGGPHTIEEKSDGESGTT